MDSGEKGFGPIQIFDSFVDLLFLADIVVSFNTSIVNEKTGDEVFDRAEIAKVYFKSGRFLLDLLATIPFDTIGSLAGSSSENLLLFGLLKLVRVLRLSKIILFMRVMERLKIYMQLLQLMLMLLMYLHIGACIWHLIVITDESWWPSTNTIKSTPLYYNAGM